MVIVSSYYEASCQLRQRARPTFIVAISLSAGALYQDREGNFEEGVGNGRSVWPESPGLHVAYNGVDNGLQLRKERANPQTTS